METGQQTHVLHPAAANPADNSWTSQETLAFLQSKREEAQEGGGLRRIEGQVRGIESMLEGERDCREIMQQLSAVHAAVQGTSRIFLQEYATTCLADLTSINTADSQENLGLKREKVIREMISLLDKTP